MTLAERLRELVRAAFSGIYVHSFEHQDAKKLAAAVRSFVEEDQPSAKPQSIAAIAKAVEGALSAARR